MDKNSVSSAGSEASPEAADAPNHAAFTGTRLKWFLAAALALLSIVLYSGVVRNGFVDWDDGNQIFENPHLGLGWENLKWIFTNYDYVHRYLPLGWLSYSVDRALFGGGPLSYHVGNLFLHALNVVLVFMLLRWLLRLAARPSVDAGAVPNQAEAAFDFAAAAGALWWAVNPLRVEVVAWASARIYVIAIAFMLCSVLSYLRASEQANRMNRWLFLSAFLYTCSLFTYPLALFGLVVFLTLDVYPLRRLPLQPRAWFSSGVRRIFAEKLLLFVPAAIVLGITLWTRTGNANLGAIVDAEKPAVVARVMQALYVWAYYAWKPWSPHNLAPEYATLLEFNPLSWPFFASAALVLVLTVLFWKQRRAWPALLAVWIIHLVILIPKMGMESFRHYHTTDRYSYLQGIAWAAAVASVALWAAKHARWRTTFKTALVIWVGFCAVLIPSQVAVWKDSVSLHGQIVASLGRNPDRRPGSFALRDLARHESFLGQLQMNRKDYAAAEASFRHSSATDPTLADPGLLLGQLLIERGRTEEATNWLGNLLQAHPNEAKGRMLLAVALAKSGSLSESVRQFEEAVRLAPNDAAVHHNFAVTLQRMGDTNAATRHYATAADLRSQQGTAR